MEKLHQTYQGVVYPWHCDHMGHMNVMYYVGKFDEATWSLFLSVGLYGKKMSDENKGMVAVEQNIQYKGELLAGDVITVYSEIIGFTDKSIKFCHEMRNAETGNVAATTTLTGLYFDKEKRRAISLSDELREKLQEIAR